MAVILEDRPIEQVRQEAIDKLIFNYSHGVISAEAFERRLDKAMASKVHQEIVDLVADLDLKTDSSYEQQKDERFSINYADSEVDDSELIVSIFAGNDRSGQWSVPKEVRVLSIFGGSDIDFTDALFHSPRITVRILCVFGGVDIFVPENINVVCKAFSIFGGVSNKAPSIAHKHAPTLTIEGFVLFGGVDISIKRTIKEKFVAFANQLKTMFNSQR